MAAIEKELRKQMSNYGKVSPEQQLLVLNRMISWALANPGIVEPSKERLRELLLQLKEINELDKAIDTFNEFLATIERDSAHTKLIEFLKNKGLYRMLYHNSALQVEDDKSGLKNLLKGGYIGIGLAALFVAFFATVSILAAPLWLTVIASGLFAASMAYVGAILYGVVNDIFATRANLPYFLLGHQWQQRSLLRTNDALAQGVAWGVAATFVPAIGASIAFGVAITITAIFVPIATFVAPVILIAMPLIAVGAEIYARKKAEKYAQYDLLDLGSNSYQENGLSFMSPIREDRAAWYANNDRNLFGFTKVPLIGVGALVSLVTLSGVSSFLPAILFGSVAATIVPVAFAGVVIVGLLAAGIYTYVNRNKQYDDRCKLAFDQPQPSHELYLDEDMDFVDQISQALPASLIIKSPQTEEKAGLGYIPTSSPIYTKNGSQDLPEKVLDDHSNLGYHLN